MGRGQDFRTYIEAHPESVCDFLRGWLRNHFGLRLDDAEDITQDTLVRCLRRNPVVTHEYAIQRYMKTVAFHVFSDWWRRSKTRNEIPIDGPDDTSATVFDNSDVLSGCYAKGPGNPEDLAASRETCAKVDKLMNDLDACSCRIVLSDESDQELADTLGMTPGAVAVRRHRTRQKLRSLLPCLILACTLLGAGLGTPSGPVRHGIQGETLARHGVASETLSRHGAPSRALARHGDSTPERHG